MCLLLLTSQAECIFSIFLLDQYLLIPQVSHRYGFLKTIFFWSEYLVNLLLEHSQTPLHDTNHNFVIIKLISSYSTFYILYTALSTLLKTQWGLSEDLIDKLMKRVTMVNHKLLQKNEDIIYILLCSSQLNTDSL